MGMKTKIVRVKDEASPPDRFPHFTERWNERGVPGVCGKALALELERAINMEDARIVERVMDDECGCAIWRFFVSGARFYVVASDRGAPITVFTQKMFAAKKRGIKHRKRHRNSSVLPMRLRGAG